MQGQQGQNPQGRFAIRLLGRQWQIPGVLLETLVSPSIVLADSSPDFVFRGCVTPKIVGNINDLIGEGDDKDLDMLDGYEDLSPEIQQKIERALDQGHVDNEDWNGVSCFLIPLTTFTRRP